MLLAFLTTFMHIISKYHSMNMLLETWIFYVYVVLMHLQI